MTELSQATRVAKSGEWTRSDDHVSLDYEGRFLRRKRLVSDSGAAFLVNLPEVTNLLGAEAFVLEDGRHIEVRCASEPVLQITGDLTRLAWHIGNRHTPCQITAQSLVIRQDHVLEAMLVGLGATVTHATAPFQPESGAYGTGRTMGHEHGHSHSHSHSHDHAHGHHDHDHDHADHDHHHHAAHG